MRRHWITNFLGWLCFATAAAEAFTLVISFSGNAASIAPLHLLWTVLGLFPSPSVLLWPLSLFASFAFPGLIASKTYSLIYGVAIIVLSVAVGVAILRTRSWARAAFIAICGFTVAAQLYTLFRLVSYSPGLLTVLQSNFRGSSAGYVSGAGPGSMLASCVIAIALFRLLIRDGLPLVKSAAAVVGGPSEKATNPPRAHQFFLFATGAVAVGELFLLLAGLKGSGQEAAAMRLMLCFLLALNVFILVRSWRAPDRTALGLAAGHGVLLGYIGLLFLPVFLFVLAWTSSSSNFTEGAGYLLLEVVPMLQLAAAVCALMMTRAIGPAPANSRSVGAWGTAFVIPLVFGTAVPQFYFQWQQGNLPIPGAKSHGDEYHELVKRDNAARELVHKYGACAFLYAKLHPESGFPESAALMGPGGTGCLNQEEAAGRPEGYSFHYAASKSEGSARSDRFVAVTQLNNQRQVYGTLVDEKGIVVVVGSQGIREQPVTADQLSWDTPGMQKGYLGTGTSFVLPRILACATALRDQSATGEYPARLVEALRVKLKPNDRTCLNSITGAEVLLQAAENSNRGVLQGQVLEYQPQPDASGKIAHVAISLRPEHYGMGGVRSYFIEDTGAEHATSEDRYANADDPAPLACEAGGGCDTEAVAGR